MSARRTLRLEVGDCPAALLELDELEVEVLSGPDAGARRRVAAATLQIGAAPENDLVLTDPAASGSHAELRRGDAGLEIRDLDSTNGTRVRGEAIQAAPLGPGEEFHIGTSVLRARPLQQRLREPVGEAPRLGALVGGSPVMRELYALLRAVGPTPVTVLVTGETGTGKELVARELHRLSGRTGAFATFDSAAADPSQVASALFGHRKGAYTGAAEAREGAARQARGGTLFLDEIGELPLDLQPRLLRLLERREVTPLGDDRALPVDVRVVAATHRDLAADVAAGRFRADLYHRLAVVEVEVPPLRRRLEDLPGLVEALRGQLGGPPALAPAGMAALRSHAWSGNVRELRNRLARAAALSAGRPAGPGELGLAGGGPAPPPPGRGGAVGVAGEPGMAASASPGAPAGAPPGPPPAAPLTLEQVERETILAALARHGGHRQRAADELAISLNTLKRRVRRYREQGLEIPGE